MPFITTGVIAGAALGVGLSGAATIGVAAAGAAIGATAGAFAGMWVKDMFSGKDNGGGDIPQAAQLPAMQTIQETESEARRKANLMRAQKTNTILTDPLAQKEGATIKKEKLGV